MKNGVPPENTILLVLVNQVSIDWDRSEKILLCNNILARRHSYCSTKSHHFSCWSSQIQKPLPDKLSGSCLSCKILSLPTTCRVHLWRCRGSRRAAHRQTSLPCRPCPPGHSGHRPALWRAACRRAGPGSRWTRPLCPPRTRELEQSG